MATRIKTTAAESSGSGKLRSVRIPMQTVSQRSEVRRVDQMRSNASFLETGEVMTNFFDGGLGDDGDVAPGGGLLEGLEKCAGLTESVV